MKWSCYALHRHGICPKHYTDRHIFLVRHIAPKNNLILSPFYHKKNVNLPQEKLFFNNVTLIFKNVHILLFVFLTFFPIGPNTIFKESLILQKDINLQQNSVRHFTPLILVHLWQMQWLILLLSSKNLTIFHT